MISVHQKVKSLLSGKSSITMKTGTKSEARSLLTPFRFGLLTALLLVSSSCGRRDERPNILLISIDSLRADHLSCYGYHRETSPRIDQAAREGARFENAFSTTSWTLPSHMALFTSLYDTVHGVTNHDRILDPSRRTLAQILSGEGYATAGFFTGPYLIPVFGFGRGFDKYIACFDYMEPGELNSKRSLGFDPNRHRSSHSDVTNPRLLHEVERWLDDAREEPFFLFLHMWDVHYDYLPPADFEGRFTETSYETDVDFSSFETNAAINPNMDPRDLDHLIGLYDEEIAYTDQAVGRVLDRLDELGLTENTIVVILSDHGEAFFEHGTKGHQKDLFDEVLRIPMIVKWPEVVPKGQVFSEQVSIIDVLPTLLEMAGVPPLEEAMGRSLGPLLRGERPPNDDEGSLVYAELSMRSLKNRRYLRAIRTPRYKVIFNTTPGGEHAGKGLLFDLKNDPKERFSLGADDADFAEEAVRRLNETIKAANETAAALPRGEAGKVELDPKIKKTLTELGYMEGEEETGEPGGEKAPQKPPSGAEKPGKPD